MARQTSTPVSPSPSPSHAPAPSILPNKECLDCKKPCRTAPIYLDSPVPLSQIKIADLHPICTNCQQSKHYNGRSRFRSSLKDSTVRAIVEKYELEDFKGVLWECAMILSGFRKAMGPGEEESKDLSDDQSRRMDSKGRRNPRKSAGIERQVREAKDALDDKRREEEDTAQKNKIEQRKESVAEEIITRIRPSEPVEKQREKLSAEDLKGTQFRDSNATFWDNINFGLGDKPDWAEDEEMNE